MIIFLMSQKNNLYLFWKTLYFFLNIVENIKKAQIYYLCFLLTTKNKDKYKIYKRIYPEFNNHQFAYKMILKNCHVQYEYLYQIKKNEHVS